MAKSEDVKSIFEHVEKNRDVDLTIVQSVPSPGCAFQRTEEVEMAGHQLAEPLQMPCKGELPVVSDTQENREGIAEHSFSINGDVGLKLMQHVKRSY